MEKDKLEDEVNKNEGIKKLKDQGELFKTVFIDDKDWIAVLQVSALRATDKRPIRAGPTWNIAVYNTANRAV